MNFGVNLNIHYARTFRHVSSYSSGSKSLNNISQTTNQQQPQSKPQSAANKQKPLALTYVDKAPKPRNPDRSRCSSVCTTWKNSLRNDKPERLYYYESESCILYVQISIMAPLGPNYFYKCFLFS